MSDRKFDIGEGAGPKRCTIEFEGKTLTAKAGEPLMVTLLANGIETASRSIKYHRPRGAFCLAGICGQCWMRIDDLPNRAACVTAAREGMTATRENAFPSADFDVFRAADHLFSEGLDHHRLGTTPIRPLNLIMQDTARRLAGLGSLSTTAPKPAAPFRRRSADVAIVGAGPAGLAAARTAAEAGLSAIVIEARPWPGGQLATGLFDDDAALRTLPAACERALGANRGELWTSSTAIAVYGTEGPERELLVRRATGSEEEHLVIVRAGHLIVATGGYEQTPLFEANDLPGHYGARALAELIFRHKVLPGRRAVIADGGTEIGARLHLKLRGLGVESTRVVAARDAEGEGVIAGSTVVAARGGTHVKGVELAASDAGAASEDRRRLACEIVASAYPVAPAFELARQAGCAIEHRPEQGGFAVIADRGSGETSAGWIFAAGDVTGAKTAELAMIEGEIAGLSVALARRDDARPRARRDSLARAAAELAARPLERDGGNR